MSVHSRCKRQQILWYYCNRSKGSLIVYSIPWYAVYSIPWYAALPCTFLLTYQPYVLLWTSTHNQCDFFIWEDVPILKYDFSLTPSSPQQRPLSTWGIRSFLYRIRNFYVWPVVNRGFKAWVQSVIECEVRYRVICARSYAFVMSNQNTKVLKITLWTRGRIWASLMSWNCILTL